MDDIIRIKVWVNTRYLGSEDYQIVEFDREEWEGYSDNEKENSMEEIMSEMIEWGYHEVDE